MRTKQSKKNAKPVAGEPKAEVKPGPAASLLIRGGRLIDPAQNRDGNLTSC